jgi:ATP-dependent helicase/nuclease subunit B
LPDKSNYYYREKMTAEAPFAALQEAMDRGSTIVTATRRLARRLLADFALRAADAGWDTPVVLPWSAWVQSSHADLRDFGMLDNPRPCLDDWQAAAIWEDALDADPVSSTLLMPGNAVEGLRDAWRLAHEWRLPWRELEQGASEDCSVFLRLAARFRQRLQSLGCVDPAELPALLAEALQDRAGPDVLFAGFDALNPSQSRLVEALGPRARLVAPPRHQGTATLAAYPDSRHELAAAAAWARRRLDENPAARLGIVVPDLEAQASLLEDLLDEALVPERLLPGRGDAPRPWNLSLGRPLVDAPIVATALLVLGTAARDSMELAEAGRLLRSPFLGGAAEEAGRRAALEGWLRSHAADRIAPDGLLGWLEGRRGAPACRRLAEGLRGCREELRDGPRRRAPSQWSAALTRALRRLGWPGDAPLDSPDWQTVQAWAELLETFARLDAVVGGLTLGDALARLRRVGAEQRFQPETPDLPVQVLGLLETAGLEFDGLWISGMHDGALPAPLRPQPLLPATLQRERGMPRACPDTELALARHMVGRLSGAADEVRFSYPQSRQDEPFRASPVVMALAPAADGDAFPRVSVATAVFQARQLEALADETAPPVTGEVGGGTGLLAAQSACPFRAFALHRLAARELTAPGVGIDGLTRGSFMHEALHGLWGELGDRPSLAGLDRVARAKRVRAAVERAGAKILAGLPPGLVRIELDEAAQRIGELLEVELLRPDFAVLHREEPVNVELGPLRIRGQVDRVDRVPDGLVVIDYKTGAASPGDWDSERPAEPQMPLYALAFQRELAGLAYALLRPGSVELRGLARSGDVFGNALPRLKPPPADEWQEIIAAWRRVLEALAAAFAAGDARVDPVQPKGESGTCAWCHLATLCRRDELLRAGALGDD